MANTLQLNNFRFSIYIDADGTITLTDLPPELRDVAQALDPSLEWGLMCAAAPSPEAGLAPGLLSHPEQPSAAAAIDQPRHEEPCGSRDKRPRS